MMFVMRKLIFLLSALLLCAGCDKNEGEPLDMAEQNRINNQFLGLWQEVVHSPSQCDYIGFHSNFKFTSFLLFCIAGINYQAIMMVSRIISRRDRSAAKVRSILWS